MVIPLTVYYGSLLSSISFIHTCRFFFNFLYRLDANAAEKLATDEQTDVRSPSLSVLLAAMGRASGLTVAAHAPQVNDSITIEN